MKKAATQFLKNNDEVNYVMFTPDGKLLIGSNLGITCNYDGLELYHILMIAEKHFSDLFAAASDHDLLKDIVKLQAESQGR
ncbi:MAG: hypothetical protein OXE52_15940 [Chloroflexi bacterium]|nr:hypothetical protein [Chloroflexota bacterium]